MDKIIEWCYWVGSITTVLVMCVFWRNVRGRNRIKNGKLTIFTRSVHSRLGLAYVKSVIFWLKKLNFYSTSQQKPISYSGHFFITNHSKSLAGTSLSICKYTNIEPIKSWLKQELRIIENVLFLSLSTVYLKQIIFDQKVLFDLKIMIFKTKKGLSIALRTFSCENLIKIELFDASISRFDLDSIFIFLRVKTII